MIGIPERSEAAPYYFTYIDRVTNPDIEGELEIQLHDSLAFFRGISEEKSLHRYAPDKWSIRQVLNHINDTERVFTFRALWFARDFETAMPSFDQDTASRAADADENSWASHIEEFRAIRLGTIALFRGLPAEAWARTGIASDNPVSVRALAYIIAGHLAHHRALLETRYL
ncbi:MAG TPA: DinB family protein [Candidatus Acidoferrum sp.]|nr:DinB family protein [Candidatus Acidoferrum sp.]